jgi:exopolysaccharide biosynthesis predicted pyruvyltransferase EpsI
MRIDINDFLAQFRGQTVHVLTNPGNAGDCLISAGGFQLMDRAGIHVVEPMTNGFDARGKTVFYPGGGNLLGHWTHGYRTLARIHRDAKRLVILPHTLTNVDALLGEFGANVTVIAREQVSYDYISGDSVGSRPRGYEALLAEDLAFSLDTVALRAKPLWHVPFWLPGWYAVNKVTGWRSVPGMRGVWRALTRRDLASAAPGAPRGGHLNAFRLDGESTGRPLPADNVDLSTVFTMGCAPRGLTELVAQRFLAAIDLFEELHTDRLHVAVGAALLGKRVGFFPNNYFKVRAVYEFSIRGRFPHVSWMG